MLELGLYHSVFNSVCHVVKQNETESQAIQQKTD